MMFELLWWAFAALSLTGGFYVGILKQVYRGHVIWLFSNAGNLACSAYAGAWPMVGMFSAYMVLAIIGVVKWRTEEDARESTGPVERKGDKP
jgi:hypothetical protein